MKHYDLELPRPCFTCASYLFFLITLLSSSVVAQNNNHAQSAIEIESQAQSASLEWTRKSVQRSSELYLQASGLWQKFGATTRQCAALRNAGRQKLILGDMEGAERLLATALHIEEEVGDPSGESQTLSLLSGVALHLGRYRECHSYYKQALALASQTSDPEARGEAFLCASQYLYEKQAVDQIVDLNQKAIEQFRLAGDKIRQAEALVEQSYAYMLSRDCLTGLQFAGLALDIAYQTGDRRGQVNALTAIANANITIGESRAALDAYKKADSLFRDDLDRSKQARVANGLGAIYENYGDWSQSLVYRERALQLFEAEGNKPGQLYTLVSAARLSSLVQDYDAATRHLRNGEAIVRELNDAFALALIRLEEGRISFQQGDLTSARAYYRSASGVFRGLNDRLYLAILHSYLGEVEERANNLDLAEKHYNLALGNDREINSTFAEANTLYHLARLRVVQDRLDDGLELIHESLQLTETLRGRISSLRLRTSYFSETCDRFQLYIDLLMRLHQKNPSAGYDVRALVASEQSRVRTLLDTLRMAGADLYLGADSESIEREKQVRISITVKSEEITNLLNNPNAQASEVEKLKREIDVLSAEYDEIQAILRERSLQYRTIADPREFDLHGFQQTILDENTLLVEFCLGRDRSYLWLVGKNEVSTYCLPPRSVIETKVNRISELLGNRDIRPGEDLEVYEGRLASGEEAYWHEGQQLSNLLFSAAADKLMNKRLIVIADKGLHYLPLAALPKPQKDVEESSREPLAVAQGITYQPSAAALLLLGGQSLEHTPARTLIAFADPIFSADDARLSNQNRQDRSPHSTDPPASQGHRARERLFLRLPATQQEAESISSHLSSDQSTILTGASASRENLLHTDFSDYQVVHFATHAFFDEKNPEFSGIVLSQFDGRGNPLDGYLSLRDIYQLSMPVSLVVVSACNSDKGKDVSGEGIVGLTRGFMQAGCKSVLSSLWKVDDAATAQIMGYFYEGLFKRGLCPAEALQQAQLRMWRSRRWHSPFYWAAFKLNGEFRHPVSPGRRRIGVGRTAVVLLVLSMALIVLLRNVVTRKRQSTKNLSR